ncbi:MAG: ribbon-helix-helix domain-containing protein [Elusimicrobia bacterium]|nr:ribbon-helix-helix domain-containing protein [Elusimicrobiota bacterium]
MNRVVNIRIPNDLRAELTALSAEKHVPLSSLVRESLREFLAVRRFRRLRGKVLPFAEAQGILTDEDVFKLL